MYKIMIIDDNMTNLIMAKKVLEDIYEIVPMSTGTMALQFLREMPDLPDIIMLDIDMPDTNGFFVLSEIKNNQRLANIPVIFLTAHADPTTEIEGYNLGALDYITKPYTTAILRKRIDLHVKMIEQERRLKKYNDSLSKTLNEKVHNIVELEFAIVEMFMSLMSSRSIIVSDHCERVSKYMDIFLNRLIEDGRFKIKDEDQKIIIYASKMHDLGKMCMPDRCLANLEDLTFQEKEYNHAHTVLGAQAVKRVIDAISENQFLSYTYNMCRYHHERYDGKGYPDRLMSTNIPLEARILAIVNSYDNFRHDNEGQEPLSHEQAMNRIKLWAGTHFDPDLCEVFLSLGEEIKMLI
ncbi:MAG: response regulator [Lachnospiraceae bacterium]|nr:response regulator [Lachnospiraceae bacterium]